MPAMARVFFSGHVADGWAAVGMLRAVIRFN